MARWWCYSLQMVVVAFMVFLTINPVTSQPEADILLTTGCSQINATNLKNFFGNLNETLRDLRSKLSNNNTYFAISVQTRNSEPVYSLAQCRKYMSMRDCLSCFDSADRFIRSCAAANGARAVLDGCFLRYESSSFYDQTTLPGNNAGLCGNRTSSRQSVFEIAVDGLLSNLSIATPKMNGFYAAVTAPVSGANTSTAYAIAQCAETVTRDGCKDCLEVAYANIKSCVTDVTDGRAVDAGCFMRYSAAAFFSNNKTTDITLFLRDGFGIAGSGIAGSGISLRMRVCIGVGSALLVILLIYAIYHILKVKHLTADDKSVEAFVKQYGSLTTKRYKYVDVKKMTNSFQVKLGQGGFGTVFKGKLSDGRLVAVKVLSSSKSTGNEFINEVSSIGRTSHVNIVNLLGFCFEYKKRALIYEFMPNGSLEKIINGREPIKTGEHIGVEKLYEIAFGIAHGLDYLHRGCNTRILHLDIKPHNILLDEDFCPKIADFGLAKLYSRKDSIVSMFEARGTIGYIAPEVFNRNFGGVSHKSDVYSYGMLILEMVGGREKGNADIGSGQTSEYFPDWIYNRLEKDDFLLDSVTTTQEKDYARKMILVGLWCIQAYPSQRPSIDEVIKMLEGSMEELEVPPKPFFHSPSRSLATMLTASESELESNYS